MRPKRSSPRRGARGWRAPAAISESVQEETPGRGALGAGVSAGRITCGLGPPGQGLNYGTGDFVLPRCACSRRTRLQRRHNLTATTIPEREWSRFYVRCLSPAEAADRAEREYRSTRRAPSPAPRRQAQVRSVGTGRLRRVQGRRDIGRIFKPKAGLADDLPWMRTI